MTEHIDDIKKELEEVRKLKEELRREVEATRKEKEESRKRRDSSHSYSYRIKPPKPPRPVRPPHTVDIDLSGITDSLEDMMDGLGRSIEMSIQDVGELGRNFRIPGVRIRKGSRTGKGAKKSDIEKIPPERVAKIIAPLGSEERLGILEFLKEGGKSFQDIENHTEKTGSSLTHHLNPLVDAGYVVKGEVRGTYYVTVEGRLAYRLAQWLTHRVEQQRENTANGSNTTDDVDVEFDDESDEEDVVVIEDEKDLEKAADHLERVADEIEKVQDKIEEVVDEIEEAREAALEEEDYDVDDVADVDDLDDLDWED